VEIDVRYCGICHSDLSMLDNEWGFSQYPLVPGHEVIGTVAAVGEDVRNIRSGMTVGLGWYAQSCMACRECLSGHHNHCPTAQGTIVGRYGGFANKVRAHWAWAIALPDALDPATSGPLYCGGITVFNPILRNGITGTHRVGVVGIGGLGHLALRFLNAWGCAVTAFSTSADKEEEARSLGADQFVNTREEGALARLAGTIDMILVTVNVRSIGKATLPACVRVADCILSVPFPRSRRRSSRSSAGKRRSAGHRLAARPGLPRCWPLPRGTGSRR
ncbi:MAG: alcohol dehydrogenase catalytic domain-containing protein, partial [Rhodoplanes sp.]